MVAARISILPIVTALGLAPCAQALAARDIPGPVVATVERVVDGDTVRVSAEIWVDQRVSVSVRLRGVDAPELYRPKCEAESAAARRARDFVAALLTEDVRLREITHDKYGGRVVARIETANGADVGAALIDEGLATGIGEAGPWCR